MEKIWLKSYPEFVPEEINPEKHNCLVALFEQRTQEFANNIAISNMGVGLTYAELDQVSKNFAAYLQTDLNMRKGDRFAIMLPNLLQYLVVMIAALRIGVIVVNVNPLYTPTELTHQLNDAGVESIIVLANFAKTVEKSLLNTSLKNIIVTQIGDMFPSPKKQIINFLVKHVKRMIPDFSIPNTIDFGDALAAGKRAEYKPVKVNINDIAYLQYTGGTTGRAKGAILTHRNILANIEQATACVESLAERGKEIIITALPLYHIFSLTANCWVFMNLGAELHLITNPRDIKRFVKELGKTKYTAITGVNTLFNALLNNEDFRKQDFSTLKLTLGGGMAVQENVANEWKKVTGLPLIEAYGLTETSPAVTINPMTLKVYNGSIGLPIPSTDVSIRDDDKQEVEHGSEGELWIKGPQVMRGYWNQPEETDKFLQDGWLATGDIVKMDDEGFIRLVDRKKDMIVVSGFNVYPNEVEEVISSHPGVLEVGVVGVPNDKTGERVKAFVVKRDPAINRETLNKHCRHQLTAYKVPKEFTFVSELPKSNVGKILRRELR